MKVILEGEKNLSFREITNDEVGRLSSSITRPGFWALFTNIVVTKRVTEIDLQHRVVAVWRVASVDSSELVRPSKDNEAQYRSYFVSGTKLGMVISVHPFIDIFPWLAAMMAAGEERADPCGSAEQ